MRKLMLTLTGAGLCFLAVQKHSANQEKQKQQSALEKKKASLRFFSTSNAKFSLPANLAASLNNKDAQKTVTQKPVAPKPLFTPLPDPKRVVKPQNNNNNLVQAIWNEMMNALGFENQFLEGGTPLSTGSQQSSDATRIPATAIVPNLGANSAQKAAPQSPTAQNQTQTNTETPSFQYTPEHRQSIADFFKNTQVVNSTDLQIDPQSTVQIPSNPASTQTPPVSAPSESYEQLRTQLPALSANQVQDIINRAP